MSECSTILSSVLAGQSERWACEQIDADTALLITSHHYSDGDTVELLVRAAGDEVVVSDGGEVLARLDSIGLSIKPPRGRIGQSWRRLLAAHAVEHDGGQLLRRATLADAADVVQEMADAVANLDGLRLLAPAPRRPAFPERVTTYLQSEFPEVEPRALLGGASGSPYRVTAAAGNDQRTVYVQTASGQNTAARRAAAEHSYTMFSDVNGHIPADRKLIVLDDDTPDWRPETVNLLTSVAFVGTWSDRQTWTDFVWGNVPEFRLLTPGGQLTIGDS